MKKVVIIQQVFNSRKWMDLVYPAMMNQTYQDIEIIAQIVSDNGGCKEYIQAHFPQVKILEPGYNIGFAKGHNEIFASTEADYYQLVNPDLILEPTYVEEMVRVMEANPQIGAATGKLLQYRFDTKQKTSNIDTTGIVMSWNGRARDRGQHEVDHGQYDGQTEVAGVSGAGPMYRKSALEEVKMPRLVYSEQLAENSKGAPPVTTGSRNSPPTDFEYFDEDFHSYWEDTDLSLALQNRGFACAFVPSAVAYHGRTAGSSKEGYKDVVAFVKNHKTFSGWVKQLNYKNHLFVVLKNFPRLHWKFFVREFFMLGYIVLLEIATLKVVPTLLRQLPLMWKKRKWIQQHRKNVEWVKLLNNKGLLS